MSISPQNAEDFRQRRNFRNFFIVIGALILIYFFSHVNAGVNSSSKTTTVGTRSTWIIPSGYTAWGADANLAYKYVDEPKCTYEDGICTAINVISEVGCPSSLYGEISFLDKAGVQYGYTNDTISSLPAGSVGELTFDILDYERFASFNLTKISCY